MKLRGLPLLAFAMTGLCHGQMAPSWINKAYPETPGRIYAVGTATVAPSEARALEQAAQNARFEVIARLKVGIQGTTTVTETMSQQQKSGSAAIGSSQQYVRQDGTMTVKAVNLPGLVVEERYLDTKAGAAYALAYLDVAVAEGALTDQIGALRSDWKNLAGTPAEPGLRPAITRLQQIKALQLQAAELGSQAALLIAAGVPASLRAETQTLAQEMGRAIGTAQKFLTMGARVEGGDLGADVLVLLRTAAIQQGFLWTQKEPAITLLIELRGAKQGVNINRKTWWDVDARVPDLVGTRAMIRVSLAGADGEAQDSFDLAVKGVGTDAFSSEQALLKELKKTLPVRFQAFLTDLLK